MKLNFNIDPASGHVHVPASVNGEGPFYFTLDTGAGYTTISKTLAEKLGIEISADEKKKAMGAGGNPVPVSNAKIEEFSIGSETFLNENMMVIDFDAIFKGRGCATGGVIGHDILKHYRVSVNYETSTLTLDKENGGAVDGKYDWIDFNYLADVHLVGIPVGINGDGPFTLILDTGSSGNVITPTLAESIGLSEKPPEGIPGPSGCSGGDCEGIGGRVTGYATMVDSLSVGRAVQNNVMLGVIDLQVMSQTGKKIDYGIIGYPFLKDYELILDYPNQRFALASNEPN
ncbi:MAG: retroviral-like aspartic protease family protein [Candidatus Thorarchaeota archaeon]|jgi:predicted aspartyl protease